VSGDQSEFTRSYLAAMTNSGYFSIVKDLASDADARTALARGEVQFVLTIPSGFTRNLLRGERPAMLLEADATDPAAAGAAVGAAGALVRYAVQKDLPAAVATGIGKPEPFEVRVQRMYNPEGLTQHNIVPGLMGIILTMTMVMFTGLAITREKESGTMENMLATPLRPLEVMTGKIVPYVFVGLIQSIIIVLAALYLFEVPFLGRLIGLFITSLLFIAANLTLGITISSVAGNQLQAMQMTMFTMMPSLLLSGFMFPFQGMPLWAQAIGNAVPVTYFLRLVRGIMLKGNRLPDLWTDLWPLLVITAVLMTVASVFYRKTLD
jgi:ABC-2 type transport system permease protein